MAINPQGEPTLRCGPTHHHACDCREAKVARLVEALETIGMATHDHEARKEAYRALDEWRK